MTQLSNATLPTKNSIDAVNTYMYGQYATRIAQKCVRLDTAVHKPMPPHQREKIYLTLRDET